MKNLRIYILPVDKIDYVLVHFNGPSSQNFVAHYARSGIMREWAALKAYALPYLQFIAEMSHERGN